MKEIIELWRLFIVEYNQRWQDLQPKGNEALWLDGPRYVEPNFNKFMEWLSKR